MRARDLAGDGSDVRAPTPAASRPPAGARGVLALQRAVGNAAVAESLGGLTAAAGEAGAAVDQVDPVAAPAEVRPGSAGLVQAVLEGERQGRRTLSAAVRQAAGDIVSEAADQTARISGAGADAAGQVEQHVAVTRGRIATGAATARTQVDARSAGAGTQLRAWQARAKVGVADAYGRGVQQVEAGTEDAATAVAASGSQAAESVAARAEVAAAAAQPPAGGGGGERGQGQAAVAAKVGAPAATEIRQQARTAAADVAQGGARAATDARAAGRRSAAALDAHRGEDAAQVDATAETAVGKVGALADQGTGAIDQAHDQAGRQLDEAGAGAAEALTSGAAQQATSVGEAGTVAARDLASKATDVTNQAKAGAEERLGELAVVDLPPDEAAAAQTALRSGVDTLYAGSGAAAGAHATSTRAHLATAGGEAGAALGGQANAARAELEAGGARHDQAASATADRAGAAVVDLSGRVQAAGDAAVGRVSAGVAASATQATTAIGQAAGQTSAAIDAHRDTTSGAVDQGGTEARAKVAEGQARFDQAYGQRQSATEVPAQRITVQRDVWGWLKGQWGDFLRMVTDPAFLVGLGVTLLLLPLGPAALVIGGMAGGVVGGIERNLAEGKPWYDAHNLVVGGLEGAVVGAVFALATAALVYFNVGLVAGALIMGTLSAAVGIVTNLVHGQPWDRGLLANFFLAALLHLISGAFKARTAPVPRPGGDPAGPGGPRGPVVDPRPVDPRAPADGEGPARARSCFVPGTLVRTVDGPRRIETVEVGDLVRTVDPSDGRVSTHRVSATSSAVVPGVLDLTVGDHVVSVSPEHPFWVVGRGWVVAGDLAAGAPLLRGDGSPVQVTRCAPRPPGAHRVHNLTVAGAHTYLVGEQALLVHNKGAAYDVANTLASLGERVRAAQEAAESQPADTPNRAAQIEQLRGMRARLNDLQSELNDAEPDVAGIEGDAAQIDRQLVALEDVLPDAPTPERPPAQELTSDGAFEALQRRVLWQRILERLPDRKWSARLAEEMRSDDPNQAKRKLLVTGTKAGSPPETVEISVIYDRTTGTFEDMHESSGASKRQ